MSLRSGLVAGLLCLAVGVLLLLRRRKNEAETPAREPEHAAT